MNELTAEARGEMAVLARECAENFGQLLECFRKHYQLGPEEALARVRANPQEYAERVLQKPADQICWSDLEQVSSLDPATGQRLWEAIKREALDELRSGHRAARARQAAQDDLWQRAQFLAIRNDLADEWQPRNGIERQLIDTMAMAQADWFAWMATFASWTSLQCVGQKQLGEEGKWAPPRLREAEAVEQAAAMADRFNKIFLRSLRALRDLRRYSPKVVVQNAAQVNVGTQQVNVTRESAAGSGADAER